MRTFFYMCIVLGLTACNTTPSNSFRLKGFMEGAKDSENIILYYFIQKNNELHKIADTTRITNGKFVFEGNIDELTAAELCFDNIYVPISVRIYLEPTTMKLRINRERSYAYELSGTNVEKENIESHPKTSKLKSPSRLSPKLGWQKISCHATEKAKKY